MRRWSVLHCKRRFNDYDYKNSCVCSKVLAEASYLPGYSLGVATPVLLRTSVLEETHPPRLFQSLQTILETVHGTCIHCVIIQTVLSVD